MFEIIVRSVGNRELLLGIDHFYRDAMKFHEVTHLLPAAQSIAAMLHVEPASEPVEGYYTESPELTAYFQWIRALQKRPASDRAHVENTDAFQLLWKSVQSPIFGIPAEGNSLLPAGRDALFFALDRIPPGDWNVSRLTETAAQEALERDDFSLVGLACRAQDAVCIAALRESVVLYAELAMGMAAHQPRFVYEWTVAPEIEDAANRFIDAFNVLVPGAIPPANQTQTERFYDAAQYNPILGRCVRIAIDDQSKPQRYYHWAIRSNRDGYAVEEFWDEALWTTERYRRRYRRD